jgi:hypothetical protein
MARYYWGINRGQHQTDVVAQGSTTGENVEVSIDLTAADPVGTLRPAELVALLESIIGKILGGNWPPA